MTTPTVNQARELLTRFAEELQQIDRRDFAEDIGDLRKRETGVLLHAFDEARGQITDLLENLPGLDQWLPDGYQQHDEAVGALSQAGEPLHAIASELAPDHDRT